MVADQPAPTITTQFYNFGTGRFGHPKQDRPLTPREAAILQSFPPEYEFVAKGEEVFMSILGRMIGNAVPPKLGEAIGRTVIHHVKTVQKAAPARPDRRAVETHREPAMAGRGIVENSSRAHRRSGAARCGRARGSIVTGIRHGAFLRVRLLSARGQRDEARALLGTLPLKPGDGLEPETLNLLNADFKEIGIGVQAAQFQGYNAVLMSQDFALRSGPSFLVGVAYTDANHSHFYDIGEGLGGPLMYLTGRGGLAETGMTLQEFGGLGYRIVADPTTPLIAAYGAWKKVYADLANGFGLGARLDPEWPALEKDMLGVIDLEKLLEVERATVEK